MPQSSSNGVAKVLELIKNQRTAMLTTIHAHTGALVARPMTCQEKEFDGTLLFLAFADSQQVADVAANPHVNVAFADSDSWVSLSGTAQAGHEPTTAQELWNPFAQAWFQCEPDDPRVAVVRVQTESAEYWDSPSKAGQLLSVVKARLTGTAPDSGENEKVSFPDQTNDGERA